MSLNISRKEIRKNKTIISVFYVKRTSSHVIYVLKKCIKQHIFKIFLYLCSVFKDNDTIQVLKKIV